MKENTKITIVKIAIISVANDIASAKRMSVLIGVMILKLLKTFLLDMFFIMCLLGMVIIMFSSENVPVGMVMMSPFLLDIVEW